MEDIKFKTITTKAGKQVVLRYPIMSDLDEMQRYINEISKEDTFITFSGEIVTREEEEKYLTGLLKDIESSDCVCILVFDGKTLIGNSSIVRNKNGRRRTKHVGVLGISISKDYRGEGLGKELMKTVLEEATKKITNLKAFVLHVCSQNHKAQELYKQFGFKEVGRIPKGVLSHGEYVDEILMHREV